MLMFASVTYEPEPLAICSFFTVCFLCQSVEVWKCLLDRLYLLHISVLQVNINYGSCLQKGIVTESVIYRLL